ncbi:MAG: pathogenicity locus [Bacteroidetes bacterium]|nr:pathogenicity locus [Bacteroidota bacterium]
MTREESIKELRIIPGVGKSIALDLLNIGVRKVRDLQGKHPQALYDLSNQYAGMVQDRCLLYVFRCAVYYAETPVNEQDPEKLKWWNWKDKKLLPSLKRSSNTAS